MSKVARSLLVPLLACVGGCVGVAVVHESVETSYAEPFGLGKDVGYFVGNYSDHRMEQLVQVRTRSDVLARWGEPAKRLVTESSERWFYHRELGWSGIIPFVVIPIPLLFPVYRDTVLVFHGDMLTAIETQKGTAQGGACGFILANPHS